jgi:hypothetical protein
MDGQLIELQIVVNKKNDPETVTFSLFQIKPNIQLLIKF